MKAPESSPVPDLLTDKDISMASYVCSSDHKDKKCCNKLPTSKNRLQRKNTTICPLLNDRHKVATEWVREALRQKQYDYHPDGDNPFPKHIWYRDHEGNCWQGFLTNSKTGQYKGWPLSEEECAQRFKKTFRKNIKKLRSRND